MDEWLIMSGAVTMLIALLSFSANQLTAIGHRREQNRLVAWRSVQEARLEREALLIGFYGEVSLLEHLISEEVVGTQCSLKMGEEAKIDADKLQTAFFQSNLISIGKLRDREIVARLIEFYNSIEVLRKEAMTLDLAEGRDLICKFRHYGRLSPCLEAASMLHRMLRNHTVAPSLAPDIDLSVFKSREEDRLKSAKELRRVLDELWPGIMQREHEKLAEVLPNPGHQTDG